jgi:hypothetical protein
MHGGRSTGPQGREAVGSKRILRAPVTASFRVIRAGRPNIPQMTENQSRCMGLSKNLHQVAPEPAGTLIGRRGLGHPGPI